MRKFSAAGTLAWCMTASVLAASTAMAQQPPGNGGRPLDGWDESGNETGEKGERRAGLPAPGIAPARPEDPTAGATTRKVTEAERRQLERRAIENVRAGDYGDKFLFGLDLRYRVMPSDLDVGTVGSGNAPSAASGISPVVRLGYTPSSSFSIAVEGGWHGTTFDGVEGDANFVSLRGVLSLYIPLGRLRPYVCAFGGLEWLAADVGRIGTDYDFAVGGGLGVTWELSNWVGLRANGLLIGTDGSDGLAQIFEIGVGLEVRFMPTGG
ncbi:MAG: hypothetical protein H6747_12880 [Deltaproteobacteria bacterium]|nr:hypothetical protein [Deltaproteobacteria bacterium]